MSRLLLVEDEQILRDVYELVLSKYGHQVMTCENGLDGLRVLAKFKPDLVLLDIFMPIMDGREFLRNFDRSAYPSTKIIVYTNLSDSKTEAEMIELGADKFILKSSLTPDALAALVANTLAVAA